MRKMYFKVTCLNVRTNEQKIFLYKTLEEAQDAVKEKRETFNGLLVNFKITPIKLKA